MMRRFSRRDGMKAIIGDSPRSEPEKDTLNDADTERRIRRGENAILHDSRISDRRPYRGGCLHPVLITMTTPRSGRVGTRRLLERSRAMQCFTYNLTNLSTFKSPCTEVWIDMDELPKFASRIAREILDAVPYLTNKGMCVGIYNQDGDAISYVPLDRLQ
jgi:hypothetical protein